MKKLLLFAVLGLFGITAFAQTQRTSRTNSRTHDRTEVTKEETVTDQDKNNPDRQTKINEQKARTKDSLSKAKEK